MKLHPLIVFWGLWFLNFSTRTFFAPILPLIEDFLSLSHGAAGSLFTSLSIGYSLSLLAAGRLTSLWGHKRTIVAGFMGLFLGCLGLQAAESYWAFHVLFFLTGMASGCYIPSVIPIITHTYQSRHWGKAIAFHDSAASLSIFVIPILVAFGLHFLSWQRLLLILATACLILPLFFWKVAGEPPQEPNRPRPTYSHLFRRRSIRTMIFLWIFSSASTMGIYSILPLFLIKEKGVGFDLANTLIGISRAGGFVFTILMGPLIDRYGYQKVLKLSVVLTGLSTVGISLASGLSLILTALIFQAILSLGFFPAGQAALSRLTSPSERSMVMGVVIALGMVVGTGVGPFVLGMIADHFSFRAGILGLGVLTALSSLAVGLLEED